MEDLKRSEQSELNNQKDIDKLLEENLYDEEKPAASGKKVLKELFSWVMVIVAAFVLAYVITHFVIIKAEVPSGSMESTIMTGDRLIGNRLAYLFSEPERGDIVIFPFPDQEDTIFIKRIIGLPGETVEIMEGAVYINGQKMNEIYINEPMNPEETAGPFLVPEGCYFMMGDNRNHSADSRYWNEKFVKKEKIIGKAWLRYEPSLERIK